MKSKCEDSKLELTADLPLFVITSLLKLYKYYTTKNTCQISWTSEYKTEIDNHQHTLSHFQSIQIHKCS